APRPAAARAPLRIRAQRLLGPGTIRLAAKRRVRRSPAFRKSGRSVLRFRRIGARSGLAFADVEPPSAGPAVPGDAIQTSHERIPQAARPGKSEVLRQAARAARFAGFEFNFL